MVVVVVVFIDTLALVSIERALQGRTASDAFPAVNTAAGWSAGFCISGLSSHGLQVALKFERLLTNADI